MVCFAGALMKLILHSNPGRLIRHVHFVSRTGGIPSAAVPPSALRGGFDSSPTATFPTFPMPRQGKNNSAFKHSVRDQTPASLNERSLNKRSMASTCAAWECQIWPTRITVDVNPDCFVFSGRLQNFKLPNHQL
jgi:hypothetical protein